MTDTGNITKTDVAGLVVAALVVLTSVIAGVGTGGAATATYDASEVSVSNVTAPGDGLRVVQMEHSANVSIATVSVSSSDASELNATSYDDLSVDSVDAGGNLTSLRSVPDATLGATHSFNVSSSSNGDSTAHDTEIVTRAFLNSTGAKMASVNATWTIAFDDGSELTVDYDAGSYTTSVSTPGSSGTATIEDASYAGKDADGDSHVSFTLNNTDTYDITVTSISDGTGTGTTTEVVNDTVVLAGGTQSFTTGPDATNDSVALDTSMGWGLEGNLTVHYTSDNTSYTTTTSYDFDADNDLVADSNDAYPQNSPVVTQHSNNDTKVASSAFVGAENGSVTVDVYAKNETEDAWTLVNTTTATNITDTEVVSISLDDKYDTYEIETEGTANITSRGLMYSSGGGGGGETGGSGVGSPAIIVLVAAGIIGLLVVFLGDEE